MRRRRRQMRIWQCGFPSAGGNRPYLPIKKNRMIFASQKSSSIILIRHLPLAGDTFPHLGKVRVSGTAYNITAGHGSVIVHYSSFIIHYSLKKHRASLLGVLSSFFRRYICLAANAICSHSERDISLYQPLPPPGMRSDNRNIISSPAVPLPPLFGGGATLPRFTEIFLSLYCHQLLAIYLPDGKCDITSLRSVAIYRLWRCDML